MFEKPGPGRNFDGGGLVVQALAQRMKTQVVS